MNIIYKSQKYLDKLCVTISEIKNNFEVIILTEYWLSLARIVVDSFQMEG